MVTQASGEHGTDNVTAWRGDLRPLWVLAIVFIGLIVAVVLIIERVAGFTGWLLATGALAVGWLIPVVVLLRWSAAAGGQPADDDENAVRDRHS